MRLCVASSKRSSSAQAGLALSTLGLVSTERWPPGTHRLSQTTAVKCP